MGRVRAPHAGAICWIANHHGRKEAYNKIRLCKAVLQPPEKQIEARLKKGGHPAEEMAAYEIIVDALSEIVEELTAKHHWPGTREEGAQAQA
jgi:hypothetical protein